MTKTTWIRGLAAALLICLATAPQAEADHNAQRWIQRHYSWHHNYYDPAWGYTPYALVVPPNARRHVEYNWGVAGTETHRINHQYVPGMRSLPTPGSAGFMRAPIQPSSTNQMGVYYIRAPR